MLNPAGKLLEKIMDIRLKAICEAKQLLTCNQYGFRGGRSTVDAIELVMQIVGVGLRTKTMVGVLMLDIRNAFNSAPWHMILTAMRSKGVPGYLCRLLDSYIDGRLLAYDAGERTVSRELTAGVPQGSVLGPTLWNFLYDGFLRLQIPLVSNWSLMWTT